MNLKSIFLLSKKGSSCTRSSEKLETHSRQYAKVCCLVFLIYCTLLVLRRRNRFVPSDFRAAINIITPLPAFLLTTLSVLARRFSFQYSTCEDTGKINISFLSVIRTVYTDILWSRFKNSPCSAIRDTFSTVWWNPAVCQVQLSHFKLKAFQKHTEVSVCVKRKQSESVIGESCSLCRSET